MTGVRCGDCDNALSKNAVKCFSCGGKPIKKGPPPNLRNPHQKIPLTSGLYDDSPYGQPADGEKIIGIASLVVICGLFVWGAVTLLSSDDDARESTGGFNRGAATVDCRNYARSQSSFPDTVNFSIIADLVVYDLGGGTTAINSTFTAENAFRQEIKYNITCSFKYGKMTDGLIVPN